MEPKTIVIPLSEGPMVPMEQVKLHQATPQLQTVHPATAMEPRLRETQEMVIRTKTQICILSR